MSVATIVDEEFKALLPALTPDQREGLERSILAEGVISNLVIWEQTGILLDGHNRLEIAQREGIPFGTRSIKLASREAAVEWIFAHQRDRRNLTPGQIRLLRGRIYNRKKLAVGGGWKRSKSKNATSVNAGGLAQSMAPEWGVDRATIVNDGKFAAAVEALKAVDPEIEAKVVTGKGPTRKAVIAAAECADEPEVATAILRGNQPKEETKKPARAAKQGPPCEGMRLARQAAGILNEIRSDDTEKAEAFAFIRRWIDAHEA